MIKTIFTTHIELSIVNKRPGGCSLGNVVQVGGDLQKNSVFVKHFDPFDILDIVQQPTMVPLSWPGLNPRRRNPMFMQTVWRRGWSSLGKAMMMTMKVMMILLKNTCKYDGQAMFQYLDVGGIRTSQTDGRGSGILSLILRI